MYIINVIYNKQYKESCTIQKKVIKYLRPYEAKMLPSAID